MPHYRIYSPTELNILLKPFLSESETDFRISKNIYIIEHRIIGSYKYHTICIDSELFHQRKNLLSDELINDFTQDNEYMCIDNPKFYSYLSSPSCSPAVKFIFSVPSLMIILLTLVLLGYALLDLVLFIENIMRNFIRKVIYYISSSKNNQSVSVPQSVKNK